MKKREQERGGRHCYFGSADREQLRRRYVLGRTLPLLTCTTLVSLNAADTQWRDNENKVIKTRPRARYIKENARI